MKNVTFFRIPVQRRKRGVALIIVLSMLVLLSALMVAFMSTVTTERVATEAASSGSAARQIADSTVNLMIAQIREATTQKGDVTWASQPGAIRTFGGRLSAAKVPIPTGAAPLAGANASYNAYIAGNDDQVFKLYSADRLQVAEKAFTQDLQADVRIIDGWDRANPDPAYTDLNDPVLIPRREADASGRAVEPRYPIMDPRARYDKNGNKVNATVSGIVDGFDAKITEDDALTVAGTTMRVPYVPMPVKWLYVLEDGTIGPVDRATKENPIVGRTAFWTDDETCKLNINTAAEGTFWDTPSVSTEQEAGGIPGSQTVDTINLGTQTLALGSAQPARGEFQRYPGHPATTCLSPVFGELWGFPHTTLPYPKAAGVSGMTYSKFKEAIYQISPFMPNGPPTSKGATRNSAVDLPADDSLRYRIRTKRLYTTVDELMFKSDRMGTGANPRTLTQDRDVVTTGTPDGNAFTPETLEKTRFFLTATSRAPEVNLFGRPRVTVWPISNDPEQRTKFDDLFVFTSTIYRSPSSQEKQNIRYNLLRYDAKSPVNDFYGTEVYAQNSRMFRYLQYFTGLDDGQTGPAIPGFGGRFSQKYSFYDAAREVTERDEILTLIFDYMRTVNLVDTGTASRTGNVFYPYTPRFYKANVLDQYSTRGARSVDWSGQVTPLRIGNATTAPPVVVPTVKGAQGLGRFPLLTEAALVFFRNGAVVGGQTSHMQCAMMFEFTTPMPGFPAIRETFFTKVRTLRPTKVKIDPSLPAIEDIGLGNPDATQTLINIHNVASHEITNGRAFMPNLGFTAGFHFYAEHKGSTQLLPRYIAAPDTDPNRNQTFTPQAKYYSPTGNNTFTNSLIYSRQTGAGDITATVARYPYMSNQIALKTGGSATQPTYTSQFYLTGGQYDVEIWSGETPLDPRATLVQTVHLDFSTNAFDGSKPILVPIGNSDLRTRFDNSLDGSEFPLTANDTVRSLELAIPGNFPGATLANQGDLRLAATRADVPSTFFTVRSMPGVDGKSSSQRLIHGLTSGHGDPQEPKATTHNSTFAPSGNNNTRKPPILPVNISGVRMANGMVGDFDRGLSKHYDGAFGNKVDEGNVKFDWGNGTASYKIPYFLGRSIEETGQTFFSPNRQLSSPVMFGSLPSGSVQQLPWQTLLFRPDRESKGHPGGTAGNQPPDHLLLDLFHLPVVEPYAISEPFSTAGKVNLNYVIAPFGYAKGDGGSNPGMSPTVNRSYLRRDTALRGVLKGLFIMAIPNSTPEMAHTEQALTSPLNLRYPINVSRTIEGLEHRLKPAGSNNNGDLFRSASEICEFDLYPQGVSNGVSNWTNFWEQNAATGDNMRERPYSYIYPRLTTKSNVYTVHMKCQAIRKGPGSDFKSFDETKDRILSEYRGSATIERFIDPNDAALKGYDNRERSEKIEPYYRYRVIATKHFSPR